MLLLLADDKRVNLLTVDSSEEARLMGYSLGGGVLAAFQKTLLGGEFLAWANLGTRGVVVERMFRPESNNIVNVALAGRGRFLVLPGVVDEHGFIFCLCNVD
eukprot:7220909-Ditylum_brightwellii.AAC.1